MGLTERSLEEKAFEIPENSGTQVDEQGERSLEEKLFTVLDGMALGASSERECRALLKELWKLPESEEFRLPVDSKLYPSYLEIIQQPMDLKTIEKKLDSNSYCSVTGFIWDMRLLWQNAKQFNKPGSEIYKNAQKLVLVWSVITCLLYRVHFPFR